MEESELLAGKLKDSGVGCRVLNAKNDRLEAEIIARAGEAGAVTVSTNMAGRGTDIKLGGENEEEWEKVVALGGLYVIGTNRHESIRIDNQLKGRAGRQGDPGSSRFFISLEDDLMKRYRVKELIPKRFLPGQQDEAFDNPVVRNRIRAAQRIIEGQNFDIRRTLTKYSVVLEQQRLLIQRRRDNIISGKVSLRIIKERLPERYKSLLAEVGLEAMEKAERQATVYFINRCWADYLDYMSYVKESIHLVGIAGKTPVDEYNKIAIEGFERLKAEIEEVLPRPLLVSK